MLSISFLLTMRSLGEISMWQLHWTILRWVISFLINFVSMFTFISAVSISTASTVGYWEKMKTSQNLSSEAQLKNFFISQKSHVSFSRYSSFCIFNHPMIYQIYDVMMSISTWDRVHFWIYVLNHNSLSAQTWPINWYKQGQ